MKTEQKWKICDCLVGLPEIPDKSVSLVIFDPPYYKVDAAAWDNQWKSSQDREGRAKCQGVGRDVIRAIRAAHMAAGCQCLAV